jgi:DNA-binding MarR family transcriptional regulator
MSDVADLSRRMAALLPAIIREFTKRETHAFARGQISVPQMLILEFLQQRPSSMMSDLASSLSITTSAVTGLIDRMERSGLVRRVRDPRDRRVIHIEATLKGRSVIREVLRQKEENFRRVLERLPAAQRRSYLQLLEDIHRILQEQPLR